MKEILLSYLSPTQFLVSFMIIACGILYWKIFREFWNKYSILKKAGKLFPGPRTTPLFGNVLEFILTKKDELTVIAEIGKKYPIHRMWIGFNLIINISLPKDIEIVIKSSKAAKKAFIYQFMEPAAINSVINGYGPKIRAHRKLFIPIINGEYLKYYMQIINTQVRRSVKTLEKKVGSKEFDIFDESEYCVADIAYEVILGIPGIAQDQGDLVIPHTIASLLDVFFHRIKSPWLHFTFLYNLSQTGRKGNADIKTGQEFFRKITHEKIKLYEALARGESDVEKPKPSILDLVIDHAVKTNAMNDKEIEDELFPLFLGFYDTVLGLNSFIILMLAMHPEAQEKVRKEVMTIFENDEDVMVEDLGKLEYINMVIKEVIRLFPVGPFLAREATDDIKLDEYTVPKGATICMMPLLTHRLEEYWDKPDSFIPERFLPENSQNRHAFAFIPFSGGPRSCIGSTFGVACLKIMIVHFIRNYEFSTTMRLDKIKLKTHISIRSVDGYRVSIKKINS